MSSDPLALQYDYCHLSLKDLIEARDAYHYHLMSKANVVGTAIGLYLIRKDEEWPSKKGEAKSPAAKKTYPRTFFNSEVRDYSWPCVIALVRKWEEPESFGGNARYDPAQIVPKTLYMSDGRAVPVCVVWAEELPDVETTSVGPQVAPSFKFGGGLPIIAKVQREEHVATAGCLVTDGHLLYALTARHACGDAGTPIYSRLRGSEVEVGASSSKQLTRRPFSEVYEDFPGRRSYVGLDVGLVRVDDVSAWTSNTYGLPALGPMADVSDHSVTLRLIDHNLVGYGAMSGILRGTIKALFYRYRSVGGYDYVGDFLIAPRDKTCTQHGDSGMVWHLDLTDDDPKKPPVPLQLRDLRPLAVEWGGQLFNDGDKSTAFAVGTSLSSVCRLLDVELVTDLARGVSGYWGRTGHYSIAAFAIRLVKSAKLKKFLTANAELISFDLTAIEAKDFDKQVGQTSAANDFVPLADVPDEIWKKLPTGKQPREGGRDTTPGKTGSDGPEHPNHYADIDDDKLPGGMWRKQCLADPDNKVEVDAWLDFYQQMAQKAKAAGDSEGYAQYRKSTKQGLLPFRVWQIFKAMAGFAAGQNLVEFLTAAGVLAHYVGDGSQPLHGSIYADGDTSRTVEREHPKAEVKTETVAYAKGVHSTYETAMVSYKAKELIDKIEASLPNNHGLPNCTTGKEAAVQTLQLMDDAAKALDPMTILDSYENAGAGTSHAVLDAMWNDLGDQTAAVMILGARYLAMIWDSAWAAGGGDNIAPAKLKALDKDDVRGKYIDKTFLPSLVLKDIKPEL